MTLSCLCGHIRVAVSRRPDFINECNCTLCRKTGARWGYFHPSEVEVTGSPGGYCRADKDEASATTHFCESCGATTHFALTAGAVARFGNGMMGVNMWLADKANLAGIELRYPDGRAWPGEGAFGHVREATIIEGAPTPA